MAIAAIIEPTNPSHSLYGEVSGISLSNFSRMASPLTSAASCVRGPVVGENGGDTVRHWMGAAKTVRV